jgi:sugar/nucleoside kinase (ribokinase family)
VHIAAVAAVDTTGAGDCFCGTLAAFLAEGLRSSRVVTTAR